MSAAVGGAATPVLRGNVHQTTCMETFQDGYIHAIVGAAACTLSKESPDWNGVDFQIGHGSQDHTVDDDVVFVRIQLKATHQLTPADLVGKPDFPFVMTNAHIQKLSGANPTITHLLVMIVPSDPSGWIVATADSMQIHHAAYWVNLAGFVPTGQESSTVRVPTKNVFDDVGLCEIMQTIGQGGIPR